MSRILQKNEIGFGILIEHDAGYVDINDNKKIISEGFKFDTNKPILINCILQKWGVKNKNGRIYPKEVLIPQVQEYQKLVDTNSAISEADHPECVLASESQILTGTGWKSFENISDDELVYTLNNETNKIELQLIDKKIYEDYSGEMYKLINNNVEVTVTPNHRILYENQKGEKEYIFAKDLYNNKNNVLYSSKNKLLKLGNWDSTNFSNYFTLYGVDEKYLGYNIRYDLKEKYLSNINIKSEDWFAFIGIYLADGHSVGVVSKKEKINGYNVVITQKKEKSKKKIINLLNKLPFEFYEVKLENGKSQFHIHDARLYQYLFKLGSSSEKYIPIELKSSSPKLMKIMVDWFQLGDGRKIKTRYGTIRNSIFSTSKKLIEDFREVILKIGLSGNITSYQKNIYIDNRSFNIKKTTVENEKIACVSVPNSNFYVMVNGKAHWTGNSSTVSLHNISHIIRKMWWGEGENEHVLYGQLEIITSPGYMKDGVVSMVGDKIIEYLKRGVRLGISSRGVGTLKEVHGENLVQDDFELVCFDLVATPSTPGAYLFPEKNQLTIGENIITEKEPINENNKKIVNELNKFLLD
jgi:hypothetical protein